MTLSQNWENIVGNNNKFFGTTCRTEGRAILGNKYFRAWHYTIHKSPMTNVFFFVCHKHGWDMTVINKYTRFGQIIEVNMN